VGRGGKRASLARFGPSKNGPDWPVKQKRANNYNLSRIGRANGPDRTGPSSFVFNFFN